MRERIPASSHSLFTTHSARQTSSSTTFINSNMIAGLSKATTLYLAPLLTLTAIVLSLFAYLAPVLLLHDKVALLSVTPSTALVQNVSRSVDGPSVFLGALGKQPRTFFFFGTLTFSCRVMFSTEERCGRELHSGDAVPHLWYVPRSAVLFLSDIQSQTCPLCLALLPDSSSLLPPRPHQPFSRWRWLVLGSSLSHSPSFHSVTKWRN